jgi:ABC-type oligopeptide transport system substrate-binding subunit
LTVQDYVRGWDLRQGIVTDDEFKRIKNLKSVDATTLSVELNGDEDDKRDAAALSSIWLSAVKASTSGAWSLVRELEGPCDGPYIVSRLSKNEAQLHRNKHWYANAPEMIKAVKIILDDGSKKSPQLQQSPSDLFTKGLLSFVEPTLSSAPGRCRQWSRVS